LTRSCKSSPAWLQAALLLLVGCSLQKFDYLQGGASGASSGGSPAAGGSQDRGGTESSGEAGKLETAAGSAGQAEAGKGGGGAESGGTSAAAGEGGMDSAGGAADKPNGGTGAVGELVNPSFETSNTMGWTVEPSDALTKKHAFVQWPVGGGSVPHGNYEFSTWHGTDAFAVEAYQKIEGLADGKYTFKGYFSRGDGFNDVHLFARHCGGAEAEPVPIPLTEPTQWLAVEMNGIDVVGGSCEVGMVIDSNASNWLNADMFSFEPTPPTTEAD
jgi:hypothetical protein